jgi:hypothetical protein
LVIVKISTGLPSVVVPKGARVTVLDAERGTAIDDAVDDAVDAGVQAAPARIVAAASPMHETPRWTAELKAAVIDAPFE